MKRECSKVKKKKKRKKNEEVNNGGKERKRDIQTKSWSFFL